MNMNLKKVISAAAALTISASSFAAFAVDFPDVDSTASYSQAVQELSSLDVISGYEDGTFKPENLVTRAEITKMIVDALNLKRAAESAKNVATTFADVAAGEGGHWANGYIATGVSKGFISGHSETQFSPDDNVTYVQAQKMLVAALGYDSYATQAGGWPSGYTAYANQLGITDGVSAMSDDQLTRAQVAQMIDNAMDVPVVAMTGMQETFWGSSPSYDIMDGVGKNYETLFTRMNTYKVYGRVTDTPKTNSGLSSDMVTFKVEKTDRFVDDEITAKSTRTEDMYYGDTKAADMIRTYAQALIKVENDEYTILSIVPAAVSKTVTLLAEDLDEDKTTADILYFFPAGKTSGSVKYELADKVDVYLNGVKSNMKKNEIKDYLAANDTAMVTLQKETQTGTTSTSSYYNVVMITACGTAVVDTVSDKTNTTTIGFKAASFGRTRMTLQKDDDSYSYTFKMDDGTVIDPTDLEEYDVLTIAYDTASFADSNFYDVIVTRSVEESAKCKSTAANSNGEWTFSTGKYKVAIDQTLAASTDYTLYFDVNGRIAYSEVVASSKKIGVLKSAYTEHNGEDKYVEIITKDGSIATLTVEDADLYTKADGITKVAAADLAARYANSVVEYKSTGTGKLTAITKLSADGVSEQGNNGEYKAASEKMGTIRVSDATAILDLSNVNNDKNDIKVVTKDDLKDGVYYDAKGYDKLNGVCGLVVITAGAGGIDAYSRMAIYLDAESDTDEDGQELVNIIVADADPANDEGKLTLTLDENVSIVSDDAKSVKISDVDDVQEILSEGSAIVYSTNTQGKVDEIALVFDKAYKLPTSFAAMVADPSASILNASTTDWNSLLDPTDEEHAGMIEGVIVKDGNALVLVPNAGITVDTDEIVVDLKEGITLVTANARVYTYNYANASKNYSRITVDYGVAAQSVTAKTKVEGSDDSYYIYKKGEVDKSDIVYAVARVYDDDDVQDLYQIVAE